jgi:hypothetical protein
MGKALQQLEYSSEQGQGMKHLKVQEQLTF